MNNKFTYTKKDDLYNEIYEIIAKYDMQGIAVIHDEYDLEVNDIHNRFYSVDSEEEMLQMVYDVFKYWFANAREEFTPIEDYKDMCHELWLLSKRIELERFKGAD